MIASILYLELGEQHSKTDDIMIYLDDAVLLPSGTTQQEKFAIMSTVNGVYLNNDLAIEPTSARKFTAAA